MQVCTKGGEFRYGLFNSTKIQIGQDEYLLTVVTDITQQKQAEESLRMSEDRFRRMTNNLPGAVYQFYARPNGEMGLYFLSERAFELLGLENELQNFFPLVTSCIVPEDREAFLESIQQAVRTLSRWDHEVRYISPGGKEMYIRGLSQPRQQKDEIVFDGVLLDVTDQRHTDLALSESETKYRILHDTMRDAYVSVDMDGHIIECNEVYLKMLGYDWEEIKKLTYLDLTPEKWHAYEAAIIQNHILPMGYSDIYEKEYRRKDGTIFPIELRTILIRDDEGKPTSMWAIVREITGRKKVEETLKQAMAYNRSLIEASLDPLVTIGRDGRITDVNMATEQVIGYARDELIGRDFSDYFTEPQKARTIYQQVFREGLARDYELDLRHRDGHITEVLYNASVYRDSSGQVAGVFAAARDISERKTAEKRLRSSEKKFSTAFHDNPAPMVITDPADGRIVDFNSACEAWSGYTRDEGIGQTTIGLGILSAEQRDNLNEAITRQGKADFISMDYKVKDGVVRKILHSARFINIDNKTHLLSHILDITEQSKAEKALIDRQARLNSIFRAAPTGIGVAVNRILTEVNDRICEMTGYTREELLGKSVSMFYTTKEEFDQVGLKKNRQMEQLGMGSVETRWRRKDGQIIDILLTSAAIVSGDLTSGVTFTALDITRRKRAEDALRESESRYRFLTERINDIVWVADMDFNLTYMSPSVERIMGYTPQERLGKKASSTMTPESAAKSFDMFVAEIQRVQKKGSETTKPILMELEYCHKNGSTVWMEVNASLLLDADGQILGAHGVSRDINMRKRAENALRESEAKYRFLTEKMYDIIWTAGLDFQLTYDSPSVERVLGYTPQERMRQKASEMLTPESYAYALEVLSAELMHDQEEGVDPDRTIKLELEYYHKNGSTVWMECIVSAIRDHDGEISGIHGVSRDITLRKQVEEELKKHRYQLEELVNERTAELTKAYEYLKQENEARKAGESALRAREMELEKGRRELVEMNSALKVLLKQREEDKVNMEMNIISNIKTSVLPYIEKLESSGLAEGQMRISSMIKSLLGEITSPFIKKVSSEFLGFTPNEIQVASLVKEGKSSKEIAEILNISLNTVHTYRYKIRIKTGLKNNKVNLRSYLQTLG